MPFSDGLLVEPPKAYRGPKGSPSKGCRGVGWMPGCEWKAWIAGATGKKVPMSSQRDEEAIALVVLWYPRWDSNPRPAA